MAPEAAPSPSSVLGTMVSGAVVASVPGVGSELSDGTTVARVVPAAPAPLPRPLPRTDPLGFGGIGMWKVVYAGLQKIASREHVEYESRNILALCRSYR